jgi:hypothetical protein
VVVLAGMIPSRDDVEYLSIDLDANRTFHS